MQLIKKLKKISPINIKVLIPAAGKGTRSGLSYPKTLFKIKGIPIIIKILELFSNFSFQKFIISNPSGKPLISKCLKNFNMKADIFLQKKQNGMGDAVKIYYNNLHNLNNNDHTLLIWGDIPFIRKKTILSLIKVHKKNFNDFTFISKVVDNAYTRVIRDKQNNVIDLLEKKKDKKLIRGERDIGVFIFKDLIIKELINNIKDSKLKNNQEHGFLYLVRHLHQKGYKVEALPIASDKEIKSLNYISDVF